MSEALAQLAALQERANQDALSEPARLARYLDGDYQVRPHVRHISRNLADLNEGRTRRLMVQVPPQTGKSALCAVWFPFWWLATHPQDKIVIGSYAQQLATTRGKAIRRLVNNHGHRWGMEIAHGSGQIAEWELKTGGGIKSVGVGAGITGFPADCVVGSTRIQTTLGPMRIDVFAELVDPPKVLSWNHGRSKFEWRRVPAMRVIPNRGILEVHTRSGRVIRCTPDHRIHTPDGDYRLAADLRPGDRISTLMAEPAVSKLRSGLPTSPEPHHPGFEEAVHDDPLLKGMRARTDFHGPDMRALHDAVHQTPVVHQQVQPEVLFDRLRERGTTERQTPVPWLRGDGHDVAEGLLLRGVSGAVGVDDARVRAVRVNVPGAKGGAGQADSRGEADQVLLEELHGRRLRPTTRSQVRTLRKGDAAQSGTSILLTGMPIRSSRSIPANPKDNGRVERFDPPASADPVPTVRPVFQAEEQPICLLLTDLREPSTRSSDAGARELQVQGRNELREAVPGHASSRDRAGWPSLRWLPVSRAAGDVCPQREDRDENELPRASHQRGREGQPSSEPSHPVRHMPLGTSSLGHDTVSLVRDLRHEREPVYDLQVEGNSNFFADEVLVHNCAIIDDPHKNRAEADSLTYREHVWDWYSADFLTRLSPGAPMLVIATPWHPDDLMHRILKQDGTEDEGGLWRVVQIHALAKPGDPIGRRVGEPLPHPKIPASNVEAARAHWEGRRRSSTVRDWNSLYQLDPQPAEGALVDESLILARTHLPPPVEPVKAAVAVDPSGGGRDVAGVIGGFLGTDQRVYVTDDVSLIGPSEQWSKAVCELAARIDADLIVVEHNYGGDMARLVVRSAWDRLARENPQDTRFQRPAPRVKLVHAKKGKLLRAEPIAQQITEDRYRFAAHLPELAHEWTTWQPTDTNSPGRIDASVYLGFELLPVPGAETLVSTPTGRKGQTMPRRPGPKITRRR